MRVLEPSSWASVLVLGAAACAPPPLDLSPSAPGPPACPVVGCDGVPAGQGRAPDRLDAPDGGDPPRSRGACAWTDPDTCVERALDAWSAAGEPGAAERALPSIAARLEDACTLGASQGCAFAGRLWLEGRAGRADPRRGLAMLVQACDGGYSVACAVGARWLDDPRHVKDAPRGQETHNRLELENACWAGQLDACFRAGFSAYSGRPGFARDRAFAAQLYTRACALGDPRACNSLGVALDYGEGVPADPIQSAALFRRACHLGDALGCANFGYMAEYGEGVGRDRERARSLYRQACIAGDTYGCLHLEMMAAQDGGAPRDAAQALGVWTRSCERERNARACAFAGVLYEDGPAGVARDETRSLDAMRRACGLHEARACEWVKEHTEESP